MPPVNPPPGKAPRILAVDDQPENLELLAAILSDEGFDVGFASDGLAALEAVAAHPPQAILLDIMMPRMSGLEVLARLKHDPSTQAIPVIMLTAKSQDEDVLTGYKQGAEYYITKPCTSRDLAYGIRLVLGSHRSGTVAAAASS